MPSAYFCGYLQKDMPITAQQLTHPVKKIFSSQLLIWAVGLTLLASCSASRTYTKKGDKLAAAGMHEEAVQQYFMALGRDRTYIKARVGLQQSGQQTMQLSTDRFYRQHQDGNYRESIRTHRSMETLATDATALGIRLEVPGMLRADYEQDLDRYLAQQYKEATRLNENRQFREAEKIFAEIKSWKSDYKDVVELSRLARIIPEYQDGRAAFDAGHYRKAFVHFEKVKAIDPSYKETAELIRVARARAQVRITLMPFQNAQAFSIPMEIPRYLQAVLGGLGNEFIEWNEPVTANPSDTAFVGTRLQLTGRIDELV
jgi:tetratricopeptide (TPR) repeat protein